LPKDWDGLARDQGLSGWFRNNIAVGKQHLKDVGATSVTLVHEVTHLVLSRTLIEEEVWARTLECYYVDDLTFSTAHWAYPTQRGPRIPAAKFSPKAPPTPFMQIQVEQWKWFAQGQLLDYVLFAEEYRRTLTAGWVRANFDGAGGIANRTGETKGL